MYRIMTVHPVGQRVFVSKRAARRAARVWGLKISRRRDLIKLGTLVPGQRSN